MDDEVVEEQDAIIADFTCDDDWYTASELTVSIEAHTKYVRLHFSPQYGSPNNIILHEKCCLEQLISALQECKTQLSAEATTVKPDLPSPSPPSDDEEGDSH